MSELGAVQPAAVAAPKLTGIGGWLILPLLGMIITIGVQVFGLSGAGETFSNLANLDAMQSNAVVIEFILNLVLFIAAPALLLVLMLGKRRTFPRWYIIWQAASFAFVVIDLFVGYGLFHAAFEASGTPFFDRDTIRTLAGSAIGVCIWIPYMLNSVRVKNTFVN